MGLIDLMVKNNISFILHRPQLSENIGACARGMKNFDFKKLFLINPKPIFPNDKILATSVGAKELIKKAKVFDTLEKSIEKIENKFDAKVVTLIWEFDIFYKAEDYHQDYYQKNFLKYLAYKKACQREEVLEKIWN